MSENSQGFNPIPGTATSIGSTAAPPIENAEAIQRQASELTQRVASLNAQWGGLLSRLQPVLAPPTPAPAGEGGKAKEPAFHVVNYLASVADQLTALETAIETTTQRLQL